MHRMLIMCVCVCVFVSHHLAWMAAPRCTNPCEDLGVDFEHHVWSRSNESQHTWVYLAKSPHQWLPDIAAWCLMMKGKKNNNLKTGAIQIPNFCETRVKSAASHTCTVSDFMQKVRKYCKSRQVVTPLQNKQIHINDSWYLLTSLFKWRTHAAAFCNGNEVHLCAMTPVARSNSTPFFAQIACSSFTAPT